MGAKLKVTELLSTIESAKEELFEAFGYEGHWRAYPIENHLSYYWWADSSRILFADVPLSDELLERGGHCSVSVIHGPYNAEDGQFVAYCMDTHTDGNQFFAVFDTAKRCTLTDKQRDYI